MNANIRRYLFGLIFFGVGIYYLARVDYLEGALYILAGFAFAFNTLATEPRLSAYKRPLVIVTWTLIIVTSIVFLWVIQFKIRN